MQGGHDDFQGGAVLELGVGVDRNAAAVVADGDLIVGIQLNLDDAGVPGHGFIHGIVENFCRQMMVGVFVGAADVHAGALANRFQAFQHLDVGGGVIAFFA